MKKIHVALPLGVTPSFKINVKRKLLLLTFVDSHVASWDQKRPHEPIPVCLPWRLRKPASIARYLLEDFNQITYDFPREIQDGPLRSQRLPHYQNKLVVGCRVVQQVSVVSNTSQLVATGGVPLGIEDSWVKRFVPDPDYLPILFFGRERTAVDVAYLHELSLRLKRADDDVESMDLLEEEIAQCVDSATAQQLEKLPSDSGALQLSNSAFFAAGTYTFIPFCPEAGMPMRVAYISDDSSF